MAEYASSTEGVWVCQNCWEMTPKIHKATLMCPDCKHQRDADLLAELSDD